MATPASPRLTFVRGDDETVLVYIDSDANETPVNITGRTYVMSIGTPSTPLVSASGTVTGASGLVQFDFTDTQTEALTVAECSYDVVQTAGSAESTLILGRLSVVDRVTV